MAVVLRGQAEHKFLVASFIEFVHDCIIDLWFFRFVCDAVTEWWRRDALAANIYDDDEMLCSILSQQNSEIEEVTVR